MICHYPFFVYNNLYSSLCNVRFLYLCCSFKIELKVNKILLLLFTFLFSVSGVAAQQTSENKPIKNWMISSFLGKVDSVSMDTAHLNFQHTYAIDNYTIANSYNGNMGSPVQSKIYMDRMLHDGFLFSEPYLPFLQRINSTRFYNTKVPYSSIRLLTGGTNYRESDDAGFMFTANANKRLNFGVDVDYMYARGEYQNQSMKRFAGSLFGSFDGRRYSAAGVVAVNSLSNRENGGIESDIYILDPPYLYDKPSAIPIRMKNDAQSSLKLFELYFNHQYRLGFEKETKDKNDSIIKEFVPVTRFIHSLKFDNYEKRYYEKSPNKDFYKNTYWSATNDTAAMQRLSNRFAINLPEEFNKLMRFGLTAYIHNDVERYVFLRSDSTRSDSLLSSTRIGGILSKHQGQLFTYEISGELALFGYRAADFNLNATLGTKFRLWRDTIELNADALVKSETPDFFLQRYSSNHFQWRNSFNKTYETRLGGRFAIPTRKLWLDVAVENKSNTIYADSAALPQQFSGSIQLITAKLTKNFRFGKLGLDNTVVYQESFNQDVLPLPKLTLYHNLYYIDKWFNVLSVQFGSYVRYFTSYYAPGYMPATGFFYNQQKTKIGNYPVVNLYANFHLKRTRFFVEYSHINQLFMKGLYYSMPNYPINPALMKMGLTWNFYD